MELHFLKSLRHRSVESGQVAVLTTLFFAFFLGVAGLAIDVGEFWNTRRQMQTAADAAAIAGVNDLAVQDTTDVTTDAQNAAGKNGFTNGGVTAFSKARVAVTVQSPPTSGTFSGNTGAVNVSITQLQPTHFLKFAGFNAVRITVNSTGLTSSGGSCIYSLDPTSSGALTIAGTALVNSACGLYVDSSSSSAAVASGGGTITAPRLGVVGGTSVSGGGSVPITTNIPAFGDPLSYLAAPTVPHCTSYPGTVVKTVTTLSPGEYCGGITAQTSGANLTLNPGLYIINGGGLNFTSSATVTGNGVTFYLTGDVTGTGKYTGVQIDGTANVTLAAPNTCSTGAGPTGGSINGVLMFQDRAIVATASNSSTITGSSTSSFDGALYFPTTTLNYAGGSSSSGYTYLVSYDLKIVGNATIGNNYSCLNGQGSIIQNASLVM